MAFHFERHEPVGDGIQRLLNERLECAIERFAECVHPTGPVHAVRKDIKKLRAVLWLVRGQIPNTVYCRETETLREISNLLGPVRDTQVHLQTLEELFDHFKSTRTKHSFTTVQSILATELSRAQEAFISTQAMRKAVNLLRAAKGLVASIEPESLTNDWKTLSSGIRETYKRGKKGLIIAQNKGDPEEFHEWRKGVKRLWYQLRLISPAWPGVLGSLNDDLARLGEGLGVDHDLFVLQTIIEKQPTSVVSRKDRKYLLALIFRRQTELRKEASPLGERVYCEKPANFGKRLACYWEKWRGEPKDS